MTLGLISIDICFVHLMFEFLNGTFERLSVYGTNKKGNKNEEFVNNFSFFKLIIRGPNKVRGLKKDRKINKWGGGWGGTCI